MTEAQRARKGSLAVPVVALYLARVLAPDLEMSSYPRVLVFNGEPFHPASATGITTSNLFRCWPHDRIAQVFTAGIDPDLSICSRNWRLSNNDLMVIKQLSKFRRDRSVGPTRLGELAVASAGGPGGRFSRLRHLLVPWVDLLPYQFSGEFLAFVREFQPEVVYSNLGNIRLVTAVARISAKFQIPVVPHFMDDWISTYAVPGRSVATSLHRFIVKRRTTQLLKAVPIGLSIGDAMAEEYRQRFGCDFYAYMSPVTIPARANLRFEAGSETRPVRFVYVGGLHLSRHKSLREIGEVIAKLRSEGLGLELRIFAPTQDAALCTALTNLDGTVLAGSVSPSEVQEVLLDSDVAVHVESFGNMEARYTRLSVSTKIPQYFAAALPVLAYGPAHVASCRYVRESGCGVVAGERNGGQLEAAIRALASDAHLREGLGRRALEVAISRHDADQERARFRETLASAVVRGRIGRNDAARQCA